MTFREVERIEVPVSVSVGGGGEASLPAPRAPRPEEFAAVAPDGSGTPLRLHRLPADGRVPIVGAAHFEQGLRAAAAAGTTVVLVPGLVDPYDDHGVRVDVVTGPVATTVGYLAHVHARRYAASLRRLRDRGQLGACPAAPTADGASLVLHLAAPAVVDRTVSAGADRTTPASAGRRRWRRRA